MLCCAVLITTSPYVTVQHGRSVKDARQYTHGQYVQCSKRAASPCTHSSGTSDLTGTLLLGKAEAKPSQLPPSSYGESITAYQPSKTTAPALTAVVTDA